MAILITPNNIKRPDKLQFELETEDDGIYTVKNVYDGKPTYFDNVPLDSDED